MRRTQVVWEQAGDGWVSYHHPDVPLEVFIRPVELADRFVIGELSVSDDKGVTAGALKILRLEPIEAALNSEGFRQFVLAAISGSGARGIFRQALETKETFDLRIKPGPGGKYPDHFYKEVAGFYLAMLKDGHKPAPLLAKATGKPVSTVHRWVAKARALGYLPEGRQGKAG
jgi:hypothetical protein